MNFNRLSLFFDSLYYYIILYYSIAHTLPTLHPLCPQILHDGWPPLSMQVATGLTEHLTMGNIDCSKLYFRIFIQNFQLLKQLNLVKLQSRTH